MPQLDNFDGFKIGDAVKTKFWRPGSTGVVSGLYHDHYQGEVQPLIVVTLDKTIDINDEFGYAIFMMVFSECDLFKIN